MLGTTGLTMSALDRHALVAESRQERLYVCWADEDPGRSLEQNPLVLGGVHARAHAVCEIQASVVAGKTGAPQAQAEPDLMRTCGHTGQAPASPAEDRLDLQLAVADVVPHALRPGDE